MIRSPGSRWATTGSGTRARPGGTFSRTTAREPERRPITIAATCTTCSSLRRESVPRVVRRWRFLSPHAQAVQLFSHARQRRARVDDVPDDDEHANQDDRSPNRKPDARFKGLRVTVLDDDDRHRLLL